VVHTAALVSVKGYGKKHSGAYVVSKLEEARQAMAWGN
jgi:hypothetical protein